MSEQLKVGTYSKKFKYSDDTLEYEFQIKKRRKWWLWLLLLLPLLLLIKCSRDIEIVTIDADSGKVIPQVTVSANYTAHYLYADNKFLKSDNIQCEQTTDDKGVAAFNDLPCSVFSYLFYWHSSIDFFAQTDCYVTYDNGFLFHFNKHIKLKLEPKTTLMQVVVVDLESSDTLPNAEVTVNVQQSGNVENVKFTTDANGSVILENVKLCSKLESVCASLYGYADTCKNNVEVSEYASGGSVVLKLRPIKDKITFFVRNVETKEPIPGALAEVELTDSHSHSTRSSFVTNVDGKGMGFYDDAFILSKVHIKASKVHFHDSIFVGDYTVEEFVKLSDDKRVVWLRPEPFTEEFCNVDTVTKQPIAGVRNDIKVVDYNGNETVYTEYSNRNGRFSVNAKEHSHIYINSEKKYEYIDKFTSIQDFTDVDTVWMQPVIVSLVFRTVKGDTGILLDNCDLQINTSETNTTNPTNSGNGEFVVRGLRLTENITIVASHIGYETNDTKIWNLNVGQLSNAPQSERDIPLGIPPCSESVSSGQFVNSCQTYSMGQMSGTFNLYMNAYDVHSDHFTVYDGPDTSYPVIYDDRFLNEKTVTLRFSNKDVTIQVEVFDSGTSWNYKLFCPN